MSSENLDLIDPDTLDLVDADTVSYIVIESVSVTAQVKYAGSWVPFDLGNVMGKVQLPGQDAQWARANVVHIKQDGEWVRLLIPWG